MAGPVAMSSSLWPRRDLEEFELSDPPSRPPAYSSAQSFLDADPRALLDYDPASAPDTMMKGFRATSYEPSHQPAATDQRPKRRKPTGWRFGVTCAACTAFGVFLLNLCVTIAVWARYGAVDGIGTAKQGSCPVVNEYAVGIHVVINALSSILLSASNYTMQCLCSPTRKEIDEAHAKGDWMDIGVQSTRNIFRISFTRGILFWLMALSSIPIHLMYNSAVFKALDANEYMVIAATPAMLDSNTTRLSYNPGPDGVPVAEWFKANYQDPTKVANLSNSDCILQYGVGFMSAYSDVLTIIPGDNTNHTIFSWIPVTYDLSTSGGPAYAWICPDANYCDLVQARIDADFWQQASQTVQYCLARIAEPHCKLQFSLQVLVTVIIMNLVKTICMVLTLRLQREDALVIVGDALASFLERPDERTKGRCLMDKTMVSDGPLRWRAAGTRAPNTHPPAITFDGHARQRWFAGASPLRWLITSALCIAALITTGVLLQEGINNTSQFVASSSGAFSLGFGAVDSRALLGKILPTGGSKGLISAVLLANLPQAIVSFLYLTYNGLFTSMLLCHEYSKYGLPGRRKALRVTAPRGQQRSSYYLHLPNTYSIPLIIVSSTLHWLISQSIFLARVEVFNDLGVGQGSYSKVGYSCLPIVCAIVVGSGMLLVALALSLRPFASSMPVAGSCSVALAAACHPPPQDREAALMPLRWGEVDSEGNGEVGHACFTSLDEVHGLEKGRLYAGSARDAPMRKRKST